MEPYQKRVVSEKTELDQKRNDLEEFIRTSNFYSLTDVEKLDLNNQFIAMSQYSVCLANRINRF